MDYLDEANRIKQRLRDCTTAAEVHAIAAEERAAVRAMAKTDEGAVMAKQIANLKAWKLDGFQ